MIITVQQHILEQQRKLSDATGTFSWLLSGITLATKMVEAKIRSAGLLDVLGTAGATNVQGETQQKLDVFANQALLHCLGLRESVAALVSEENENPVIFDRDSGSGKYIIVFDPLDGSSNIDVNVNVGTIFSIFRRPEGSDMESALLQPGSKQIAAGYVVYGPSTMLVYTTGQGVYGFTLDTTIGAYVLSHEKMQMPGRGSYYSVNEANADSFPKPYQEYLARLRRGDLGRTYSSRYIGSLVADFHRNLLYGGFFMYPADGKNRNGKLRLLYEAAPLAMIAEQAGGRASDGVRPINSIIPDSLHQRTPLFIGTTEYVQLAEEYLAGGQAAEPVSIEAVAAGV